MPPSTFTLVLLISTFSHAHAQEFLPASSPGVIPATVREAPDFTAPPLAIRMGLSGKLNVRVNIDEDGNVISVESVTGPGSVCPSVSREDVVIAREAARNTAMLVKFDPAMMDGRSVASSGWLYFDLGSGSAPKSDAAVTYSGPVKGAENNPPPARGDRYTVLGSPPDYKGPVNTGERMVGIEERSQNSTQAGTPGEIRGGVLNGKARSLPKPPYPPAARAVRADGPVTIQVLIDEDGHVFSAEAISGHPLLRSASRLAACESKFSPTLLSGNPVKVSGVITYNFVAP